MAILMREQDKDLPRTGCEHLITIGADKYLIFCNFQFMLWFERAYNRVLGLQGEDRLSVRGLLNRLIEKKFDVTMNESVGIASVIQKDWFYLPDGDPYFLPGQIEQFIYDIGYLLGLLLGGADTGKKLLSLLVMAKMMQEKECQKKNLSIAR